MNDLRISLVQANLAWEDPASNYAHLSALLRTIGRDNTDIVALPEMFTTGFSMEAISIAETWSASMESLAWMQREAAALNASVIGSIAVEEDGRYFNRLLWVFPNGDWTTYDKRHLFTMAGEHTRYTRGEDRLVVSWRGWKICPMVCYDLRFPVWSRNQEENGEVLYDVLVYVANWPSARRDPWMKLAVARAIENQAYVAAVNRVGTDGNGLVYSGDSALIDPRGNHLYLLADEERIATATCSANELHGFREKFPVLRDADRFEMRTASQGGGSEEVQ